MLENIPIRYYIIVFVLTPLIVHVTIGLLFSSPKQDNESNQQSSEGD